MITQERLKEVLSYDPETGIFTWKVGKRNQVYAGREAGSVVKLGYRMIKIDGHSYLTHRLAWLYFYGELPALDIDHRDGNPSNNKIDNIRLATDSENLQNQKRHKNNSSGYIRVHWDKEYKKWCANISINKKQIYLGAFDNPQDASQAYLSAKKKLHTFNPIPREEENNKCEHF